MTGKKLFCASIDIGTTYSGYAFSSHDDFQKEPTKINTNMWSGSRLLSQKATTAVLLDASHGFVAFGNEAENEYSELVAAGKEEDYYYFHRFKMQLYERRITRDIKIRDEGGKEMEALIVFQYAIQFLQDHLFKCISEKIKGLQEHDLHVLTVPAIWGDSSNKFMMEAAKRADIRSEQLSIISEPHAASIYCQHLEIYNGFPTTMNPGMKFMVVDLGDKKVLYKLLHSSYFFGRIAHSAIPGYSMVKSG